MSRIGKPIVIPTGVEVKIDGSYNITVKGPQGVRSIPRSIP